METRRMEEQRREHELQSHTRQYDAPVDTAAIGAHSPCDDEQHAQTDRTLQLEWHTISAALPSLRL